MVKVANQIWKTLERIRRTLGWSHAQLMDHLAMTEEQYWALRESNEEPSVSHIMHLSAELEIGFETILFNTIDYHVLIEHHHCKNLYAIPERYMIAAASKRRTAAYLLDFIEKRYGKLRRQLLLRKFQMHEEMFFNLDAPINSKFSIDLANSIARFDPSPKTFEEMGMHSARFNRDHLMSKELSKSKDEFEAYELLFKSHLKKYIEQNFSWQIEKKVGRTLLITGTPNQDIYPLLEKEYATNPWGFYIRQGFLKTIPTYIGKNAPTIEMIKSPSQGDPVCSYLIKLQ